MLFPIKTNCKPIKPTKNGGGSERKFGGGLIVGKSFIKSQIPKRE